MRECDGLGERRAFVIPAQAGIQFHAVRTPHRCWIPAFAGLNGWSAVMVLRDRQARQLMLGVVGLALVALVATGCERQQAKHNSRHTADRPNVLLITLDTTRADRLGCYGYADAQTPTLDALAASGVRFDQAFAQAPFTLPSHASLLTGTYPRVHGIRMNGITGLGDDIPTLAETFKRRGYRTGAFVATFVLDSRFGLNRGFDTYDDNWRNDPDARSAQMFEKRPGNKVSDVALRWLNADPGAPFFAWVHFYDAHHPYDPPAPYREELADPYDGEIAFVDAQIARLMDWLESHNLRSETLVVVVGDHGESLGDHDEFQHGFFIYNATMRVPLIFSWPGHLPSSHVVSGGIELVDVMPTIHEVLGLKPAAESDGQGSQAAWKTDDWEPDPCYGENQYPRLKLGWAPLRFISTGRWKYIEAPRPELYDRQADPGELNNLATNYPDVASQLRAELIDLEERMVPRNTRSVVLDAQSRATLENLGYLGGAEVADAEDDGQPRRDPKDMIWVMHSFMEAKALIEAGEHARAVERLKPQVPRSPESGLLHQLLGKAYLALNLFAEAQKEFDLCLSTFPDDPETLCAIGDTYFHRSMFDKAIPYFEKALRIDSGFGQVHSRLGSIYARREQLARAEKHFRRYAALEPQSANALSNLANLLLQRGQSAEAVNLLRTSIQYDPSCVIAHHTLYEAVEESAGREAALKSLRQSVQTLPQDRGLVSRLAWILATSPQPHLRNAEEAIRLAGQCSKSAPNNPAYLDVLAAAYAAASEFPKAIETARHAKSLANTQGNTVLAYEIELRLQAYQTGRAYAE